MRRTLRDLTAGLALVTITLTGCTDGTDVSDEPTSPGVDAGSVDEAPEDAPDPTDDDMGMSDVMPDTMDGALDPVRVALALVLLDAGDIEAAVAEGLVDPAEVDAAERALTDGTAQDWFDLADAWSPDGDG